MHLVKFPHIKQCKECMLRALSAAKGTGDQQSSSVGLKGEWLPKRNSKIACFPVKLPNICFTSAFLLRLQVNHMLVNNVVLC